MNECSCFIGSTALWFWTPLCISIHKLLGPFPFCIWITSKPINVIDFSKVFNLILSSQMVSWSDLFIAEAQSLDNAIVGCGVLISGSQNGRDWCSYVSWFAGKMYFNFMISCIDILIACLVYIMLKIQLFVFFWEVKSRKLLFFQTCTKINVI